MKCDGPCKREFGKFDVITVYIDPKGNERIRVCTDCHREYAAIENQCALYRIEKLREWMKGRHACGQNGFG